MSADGVHFEQSTCYHRYTIEMYQHFALLADRSNLRVLAEIESALERMVDFLLAVSGRTDPCRRLAMPTAGG